jgi:hypothetical protein
MFTFKPKGIITNKRVSRATEPLLGTTSTLGGLSLNELAQEALELEPGDRVVILEAGADEEGNPVYGVAKGHVNEANDCNYGQKVQFSGGASSHSGTMLFSSASTWGTLGGNDETKRYFKLMTEEAASIALDANDSFLLDGDGEDAEVVIVPNGTEPEDVEVEGCVRVLKVYPLVFARDENKQQKGEASAEASDEVEDED